LGYCSKAPGSSVLFLGNEELGPSYSCCSLGGAGWLQVCKLCWVVHPLGIAIWELWEKLERPFTRMFWDAVRMESLSFGHAMTHPSRTGEFCFHPGIYHVGRGGK
jgi:hypothetical protein